MLDFHDWISSWSHLLMAGFMAFAGLILYRLTHTHPFKNRTSVAFFASAAVVLYTTSGLYHGIRHNSLEDKRTWELLDRTAIFILIYGSNVPLLVYLLPARRRNWLLLIMGSFVVIGSALLWTNPNYIFLVICYIGVGVFGMVPIRTYYRALGKGGLLWIFIMASSYIAGAICDAVKWPTLVPGLVTPHEMFHIMDMMGTLAHVVLVMRYVIPAVNHAKEGHFPVDLRPKSDHNSIVAPSAIPPVIDRF
ncbi:hypothetical protein BH11PLA2_BH11PLA2_00630 [soil metagenome]